MPREKDGFRENYTRLKEVFGDVECISITQAANYLGTTRERILRDDTFPRRRLGEQYIVVLVNFARWLATQEL